MMMSFGSPFAYFPPTSSMMMPDVDWIAVPRARRPLSVFDDVFNMDRELERFWRTMEQPIGHTASSKKTSSDKPDQPTDNAQNSWFEISSTFNSAQDGPHSVSRRTVHVRDASGRDELVEERSLDGRVSKRKTDLRNNTVKQLGDKEKAASGEQPLENQQMTTDVVDEEFERLWTQDDLVKRMMAKPAKSHKRTKHKTQQQQQQQSVPQSESMMQDDNKPNEAAATEEPSSMNQFPDTTTTPSNIANLDNNEYSFQLKQIAQLGLPCDSTAYRFLQQTQGSVERTVMGLLSLQRMKAQGFDDEAACVTALCNCNFDLDKACELLKAK
jgi:hypothetical protein